MTIHKSKALDIIEFPNGCCMIGVDANKRFKDGDIISTNSATILSLEDSRLNFVVIS